MNETAESMADGEDPPVREYLDFLARDMERHPARLQAVVAHAAGGEHSLLLRARFRGKQWIGINSGDHFF